MSSTNSSTAIFILAEPVPEPSVTLLKSLSVPPLMYPAGLVVGITAAVLIDVPTTVPAPLNSTLNVFSCGSIPGSAPPEDAIPLSYATIA